MKSGGRRRSRSLSKEAAFVPTPETEIHRMATCDVSTSTFFFAAHQGDLHMVMDILENADDLGIGSAFVLSTNERTMTALQIAAARGNSAIVNSILEYAQKYNILEPLLQMENADGKTALHEAVLRHDDAIVSMLLKLPLNFRIRDSKGALLYAETHDIPVIAALLQEHIRKTEESGA